MSFNVNWRRRNSLPYTEALPTPHVVTEHPIPSHGDTNYREPSILVSEKPFYIPPRIMSFMDKNDSSMHYMRKFYPEMWTRPSWGWVGYRLDYECTDEEWQAVKRRVRERYIFTGYYEEEKFRIQWVEDKERFEGKGVEEVRTAFNEWRSLVSTDRAFDSYSEYFCLAADRRSVQEILADISAIPILPPQTVYGYSEATYTSVIVVDCRAPENIWGGNHPPVSRYEEEVLRADGVEVFPGYMGWLRCSLDDVAFVFKEEMRMGDPQDYILALARSARRNGGVWRAFDGPE